MLNHVGNSRWELPTSNAIDGDFARDLDLDDFKLPSGFRFAPWDDSILHLHVSEVGMLSP